MVHLISPQSKARACARSDAACAVAAAAAAVSSAVENRPLSSPARAFPPSNEVPGGLLLRVLPMMTVQPLLGTAPQTPAAAAAAAAPPAPVAAAVAVVAPAAVAEIADASAGAGSVDAVPVSTVSADAVATVPFTAPNSAAATTASPATTTAAAAVTATPSSVMMVPQMNLSTLAVSNQALRAVMHAYLRKLVVEQLEHYNVSDKLKSVWTGMLSSLLFLSCLLMPFLLFVCAAVDTVVRIAALSLPRSCSIHVTAMNKISALCLKLSACRAEHPTIHSLWVVWC